MKIILIDNYVKWYNPITWLYGFIKFFTKSNYNHCCISLFIDSIEFIAESNSKGVILTQKDLWLNRIKRKQILEIDCKSYLTNRKNLLNQLGKPYDYSIYYKFFFNQESDHSKLYCYELLSVVFPEYFSNCKLINGKIVLNKLIKELRMDYTIY